MTTTRAIVSLYECKWCANSIVMHCRVVFIARWRRPVPKKPTSPSPSPSPKTPRIFWKERESKLWKVVTYINWFELVLILFSVPIICSVWRIAHSRDAAGSARHSQQAINCFSFHSFRSRRWLFRECVCVCVSDILLFWRYKKFACLIYLPFNQFMCSAVCLSVSLALSVRLSVSLDLRVYVRASFLFIAQTNSTIYYFCYPNVMDYSFQTNFVHSIRSIQSKIYSHLYDYFSSLHFILFNLIQYFQSERSRSYFLIWAQHFHFVSFWPSILELCVIFLFFFRSCMHPASQPASQPIWWI